MSRGILGDFPRHNGLHVVFGSRRTTAELTCNRGDGYGTEQYTTELVGLAPGRHQSRDLPARPSRTTSPNELVHLNDEQVFAR